MAEGKVGPRGHNLKFSIETHKRDGMGTTKRERECQLGRDRESQRDLSYIPSSHNACCWLMINYTLILK